VMEGGAGEGLAGGGLAGVAEVVETKPPQPAMLNANGRRHRRTAVPQNRHGRSK
jgi:hypothetical protein